MFLKEILSQPAKIRWEKKILDYWLGRFKVKDTDYIIEFIMTTIGGVKSLPIPGWEIAFSTHDVKGKQKDPHDLVGGKENQFIVLATVIEGIKQFIKAIKPDAFYFASKGKKRTTTYRKIINRFASQLGYSLARASSYSGGPATGWQSGSTFVFLRKDLA